MIGAITIYKILAIDPANKLTSFVLLDTKFKIYDKGKIPNQDFLQYMQDNKDIYDIVACEVIVNMGVSGRTLYHTAEMIGKIDLMSQWLSKDFVRVTRPQVKKHFGVQRSTKSLKQPNADTQISRSLAQRFSKEPMVNYGKGRKDSPDFFYGFKEDMWQAMSVGVYYIDTHYSNKQSKFAI